MLHDNPSPMLVPFQAVRVRDPALIWRNQQTLRPAEDVLEKFAFVVAQDSDEDERGDDAATFYAERYGGKGLLANGGGARCGLRDGFQVKGIGCNPLVGRDVDYAYSHGALPLADAIRECAWGEVLAAALPWGAVRVAALIDTRIACSIEHRGERRSVRRALIVREAALRPGHFDRALYFRPQENVRPRLATDAARVRYAIQKLPDALPLRRDRQEPGTDTTERVGDGLTELASRLGEQAAAAKAKRLMHGALSSSNICLDGRWIDYGSVTMLPGFANTQNFNPGFWSSESQLPSILADLRFYTAKYLDRVDLDRLPTADALKAAFYRAHRTAMVRRFARLTGFPDVLLEHATRRQPMVVNELARQLAVAARRGTERRSCRTADEDSLHLVGDVKLGRVLLHLAVCDVGRDDAGLSAMVTDPVLRNGVVTAYQNAAALFRAAADGLGLKADALRRLVMIDAARRAQVVPTLARGRMVVDCEALADDDAAPAERAARVCAWIAAIRDTAAVALADPAGLAVRCWQRDGHHLDYDASDDVWLLDDGTAASGRWSAGDVGVGRVLDRVAWLHRCDAGGVPLTDLLR